MSEITGTPKLNEALSKAQGEFKPIYKNCTAKVQPKDSTKSSYSFDYADLSAIFDATQDALTKNGLSITDQIEFFDTSLVIAVRLRHLSGEEVVSMLPFIIPPGRPQELGSLITYYRRYLTSGMLHLASEMDDDGNIAVGNEAEIKPNGNTPKPFALTEPQQKRLFAIMKKCGIEVNELKLVLEDFYGVASSKDLNKAQYDEICTLMDTKAPKEIFDMAHKRAIDRGAVKP